MAGYSFETISPSQAASFGADDYLFFISDGATANDVSVAPFSSGFGGSGINVTFGGKTVTFPNSISTASIDGHILFNDNSHLQIGTDAANTDFTPLGNMTGDDDTVSGQPNTVFALGGADTIDFSDAAAHVANYLNGGFGVDTIMGGDANNHIYGNSISSQVGAVDQNGQTDGGDTITVGTGTNYINGNGGDDTITVDGDGRDDDGNTLDGSNRIFGGSGNDTVTINGAGITSVNGNVGNDTITDNGSGDNFLRGGQGDDIISGGSGHSTLMGDVGKDTLIVHGSDGETDMTSQHINVLTGGEGSDTFDFGNDGAGQAALFGQVVYYQEITDFTQGVDKIALGTNPTESGDVGTSATVFASVHDAEIFAQTQLSGAGTGGSHVVESLSVGSTSNTYLFYSEDGNTAANTGEQAGLGIIHLDGVTASSISFTDFQTSMVG